MVELLPTAVDVYRFHGGHLTVQLDSPLVGQIGEIPASRVSTDLRSHVRVPGDDDFPNKRYTLSCGYP